MSLLYLFYFIPTHPLDYQITSWTQLIDGCFQKNAVTGADQGTIRNSVREELSETSRLLLRCRLGGLTSLEVRLESPVLKTHYSREKHPAKTNPNAPEKEMGQPTKGKSLRSHPHGPPGRYPGCFTNSLWRVSFLCWVLGKFGVSSQGMWAKSFKEYIFQVLGVFFIAFSRARFRPGRLTSQISHHFHGTKSWDPNKKISRDGPKMEKMLG